MFGERSEQVMIYSLDKEGVPACLYHNERGNLVFDQNFVLEGGRDPEYQFVYDYGISQEPTKELVPEGLRMTQNTRPDLTFLGFDSSSVAERMAGITEIANDQTKSFKVSKDRQEYRAKLAGVYQELIVEVNKRLDSKKALFFAPKNGGIFVRQVYEEAEIPKKNFFDYKLSRVLVKNDGKIPSLMVGMVLGSKNPDVASYDQFVFADDCLASKVSADATLRWLGSLLTKAGKKISEVKVVITVSAGSQRGLVSLLSPESKQHLGFESIETIAAVPVYRLNNYFYLMSADGKKYIVGDMGKWTLTF